MKETNSSPIDIEGLIEEVDEDMVPTIFEMFLDDTRGIIGELDEALKHLNQERLRKLAHKVKGCCRAAWAHAAADYAAELEDAARDGRLDKADDLLCNFRIEFDRIMKYIENYPKE